MFGLTPQRLYWLRKRIAKGELWRAVEFKLYRLLERRLGLAEQADRRAQLPLAHADERYLFTQASPDQLRAEYRQRMRIVDGALQGIDVEKTYPLVYEQGGRFLRYALLPAQKQPARGLVVSFHGFNGFQHLGPSQPWEHFDLLTPWDTFGWRRQGSWFWGEAGQGFVADLVQGLIAHVQTDRPQRPIFCFGGSMGGFGALWHGLTLGQACLGMYVFMPQVDMVEKVRDDAESKNSPYRALMGPEGESSLPDLVGLARQQQALPPLLLVQNQHDAVNPYADHAAKLIGVYDEKRAWYGLRIYPASGHFAWDASPEEAAYFFRLILDKQPIRPAVPRR